jgi:hypothetical protein
VPGYIDEEVREVDFPKDQPDGWHDDVGDEGARELTERGADDDADSQVDDVATRDECLEVFEHAKPYRDGPKRSREGRLGADFFRALFNGATGQ